MFGSETEVGPDSIRRETIVGNSLSGLGCSPGGLARASKIFEAQCGPPFEILKAGDSYVGVYLSGFQLAGYIFQLATEYFFNVRDCGK
mgnify:CR=1 FL=1